MFKGNDQKVYFDGELLATLTKAEAKVSLSYEEIELCGRYDTQYEYVGYTIEGTITRKKVDSRVLSKLHNTVADGTVPQVTITGVNLHTKDNKVESVTIPDAVITELALLNAEAKTVAEEEIPFNASTFIVNSFA